ncbi:RNA methyltransferase [Hydromonas duriensis]|nr:RNA methyltransferase [Hydromonas duriensis]
MPTSHPLTDALAHIRIIIVRTSHPGNVGQVARAMANMGLRELYLTSPRFADMCAQPDAIALASGATDVLDNAVIVPDLATALQGVNCAFAFSARTRDLAPPLRTSGEAAAEVMALFTQAQAENMALPKVAFVFGAERSGLVNDEVMLCQRLCQIEANPEYNSLNLAQAVQVMTYSLRQAALHGYSTPIVEHPALLDSADVAQLDGMLNHWEAMLTDIGMINPNIPTEMMPRLRALFSRTQLSTNEVNFLRGLASTVQRIKKKE